MTGKARNLKTATVAVIAMITLVAVLIGPSAVLAQTDVKSVGTLQYTPRIQASGNILKFRAPAREFRALSRANPRRATMIPEPVRTSTSSHSLTRTSGTTTAPGTNPPASPPTGGGSELAQAQAILAGYVARYPILAGASVSIGTTPGGHQAVAYYTVGRILISPTHTASLDRIIGHEIWHIIDYRDNGIIDWGESVPPSNYP